jgi:hypothetical protein
MWFHRNVKLDLFVPNGQPLEPFRAWHPKRYWI